MKNQPFPKFTTLCLQLMILLAVIIGIASCGSQREANDPAFLEREDPLVCYAQDNKLVTSDYVGAMEANLAALNADPATVGHAADLEIASMRPDPPTAEIFAIAWVTASTQRVTVRRYNSAQKRFTGYTYTMSTDPSPNWVRSLGFDEDCAAIGNENTCAWFTWENSAQQAVNWRAVGPNGYMSSTHSVAGHQPSGAHGNKWTPLWGGSYIRRKLLAYISPQRDQVMVSLLDSDGNPIAGKTVSLSGTMETNWAAYQTAVAWDSTTHQWLVVWTEIPDLSLNRTGRIRSGIVDFNGNPEQEPGHLIMYCDNDGKTEKCNPRPEENSIEDARAVFSESGVRTTNNCYCHGIWLASSWYSSSIDRYRLHHYNLQARIAGNGIRQGDLFYPLCSDFCPITEANFYYPGGEYTPFQLLADSGYYSESIRLVMESEFVHQEDHVLNNPTPQGFRSDTSVAAALATDDGESPHTLTLSIVDLYSGGCPR